RRSPKSSCVSLPTAPIGVRPVSPETRAATAAATTAIGSESAAIQSGASKIATWQTIESADTPTAAAAIERELEGEMERETERETEREPPSSASFTDGS